MTRWASRFPAEAEERYSALLKRAEEAGAEAGIYGFPPEPFERFAEAELQRVAVLSFNAIPDPNLLRQQLEDLRDRKQLLSRLWPTNSEGTQKWGLFYSSDGWITLRALLALIVALLMTGFFIESLGRNVGRLGWYTIICAGGLLFAVPWRRVRFRLTLWKFDFQISWQAWKIRRLECRQSLAATWVAIHSEVVKGQFNLQRSRGEFASRLK